LSQSLAAVKKLAMMPRIVTEPPSGGAIAVGVKLTTEMALFGRFRLNFNPSRHDNLSALSIGALIEKH
jgi:hypothetical protein